MSVDFQELDGLSYTFNPSDGTWSGTYRLKCDWDDRNDLILELVDRPYPHTPDGQTVVTGPITVTGTGYLDGDPEDNKIAIYSHAILTVSVGTPGTSGAGSSGSAAGGIEPGSEFIGGIWISESFSPSVEAVRLGINESFIDDDGLPSLGKPLFRWKTGPRTLNSEEAPFRTIRKLDYRVTFHRLTNVPTAVDTYIGAVNDNTVVTNLAPTRIFPAGTLLYMGSTYRRSIELTTGGLVSGAWNLEMMFSYRPEGWDKFWRGDLDDFDTMEYYDGTSWEDYDNYPRKDFTDF